MNNKITHVLVHDGQILSIDENFFPAYLEKYPDAIMFYGEDAWLQADAYINSHQNKKYDVGKWKEISNEEWREMLEVLPPEDFVTYKKTRMDGGKEVPVLFATCFRLCEYTTGDITSHFISVKTNAGIKYYSCNERAVDNKVLLKNFIDAEKLAGRL